MVCFGDGIHSIISNAHNAKMSANNEQNTIPVQQSYRLPPHGEDGSSTALIAALPTQVVAAALIALFNQVPAAFMRLSVAVARELMRLAHKGSRVGDPCYCPVAEQMVGQVMTRDVGARVYSHTPLTVESWVYRRAKYIGETRAGRGILDITVREVTAAHTAAVAEHRVWRTEQRRGQPGFAVPRTDGPLPPVPAGGPAVAQPPPAGWRSPRRLTRLWLRARHLWLGLPWVVLRTKRLVSVVKWISCARR